MVDFIVDVLGPADDSLGFFFVQVKATSASHPASRCLRLQIDRAKYNKLVRIPVPTFLIGVETNSERSFVVAAVRPKGRSLSSISKRFDLADDEVRIGLYKEVIGFWRKNRPNLDKAQTRFSDGH